MNVKQSGNTHLYIVNRAIELLAKSDDPTARAFAAEMNLPANRNQWENGIWDGDGTDHVDFPNNMGTHFYNGALKDWKGKATSVVTYDIVEGSIIPIVGVIGGAVIGGPVSLAGGAAVGGAVGAAAQKIVFKNNKSCKNARECAKERVDTVKGPLNTTNSYSLGLALHYMTNATQPMHTSSFDGLKIPNNLHPQWEYYAPFVQARFTTADMAWDKRWAAVGHDGFHNAAVKSNSFAPRLSNALHIAGDAGVTTIQSINGIGPYTGFNFYNDPTVDSLTGEILRDAFQSTASYLYAVAKARG